MAYRNKHLGEKIFLEQSAHGHELWKIDGNYHIVTKCMECNCNICKRINSKRFQKTIRIFCSQVCLNESQRHGVSKIAKEQYFMDKFGVTNPYGSKEIREQIKQTNLERYGFDVPSKSQVVRDKMQQSMIHTCKTTDCIERGKQTMIEKYGCHYLISQQNRDNLKHFAQVTYGVDHHMQSPIFQEKLKQVYIEKYGVENPLQIEETKNKVRQTCLEKYGVDNVFKRPEMIENCAKKKLENCLSTSSKAEMNIYDILCQNFVEVERQIPIFYKKDRPNVFWLIDFYLPSYETYIQFDGIYWHGVEKEISELKEARSNGDKSANMQLLAKYKDKHQNYWFKKNNIRLYRIIENVKTDIWLAELRAIINDI